MFRLHIVWRREITPGERAFLSIRLAKRDGETRSGELFAEIERVRGIVDVELREHVLNIRAADEPLIVEDGDRLAVGEDAVVRVGDFGLQRAQLVFAVGE